MRHARDGVTVAIEAATRILSISGRSEPPELENPDVSWGDLASEGVWAPTRDGQRIHIGIAGPAEDRAATVIRPSMRVFAGVDADTDVMAQTTAEGVRFVTVLHGPDAPEEFRFPLRLGDGLALDVTPSGGYDVVHERYGATVGRFYAPVGLRLAVPPDPGGIPAGGHDDRHDRAAPGRRRPLPVVADPHYVR